MYYQKKRQKFLKIKKEHYICNTFKEKSSYIFWEISSAGSEHLPYKQGVIGSNPIAPTQKNLNTKPNEAFFIF